MSQGFRGVRGLGLVTIAVPIVLLLLEPGIAIPVAAEQNFLGVYFDEPAVSVHQPVADASRVRSLCHKDGAVPTLCTPGVPLAIDFNATDNNGLSVDYAIASDVVATVWLSANTTEPLPVAAIRITMLDGLTSTNMPDFRASRVPADADGNVTSLTAAPTKFLLAFAKPAGATLTAGVHLNLRISVEVLGVPDGPFDVFLHYGSAAHQSGLVFAITVAAGAHRLGNDAFRISLAAQSLVLGPPAGGATSVATLAAPAPGDGPTVVEWGAATSDRDYVLASDLVLNVTLRLSGTPAAGVFLDLRATLTVDGDPVAGTTRMDHVHNDQAPVAAATPFRVTIPFATAGRLVEEGALVELRLEFNATAAYELHYGSLGAPSGLVAAASTSAQPAGPVATTISTTTGATTSTTNPGSSSPETTTGPANSNEGAPGGEADDEATGNDANSQNSAAEPAAKEKDLRDTSSTPGLATAAAVGSVLIAAYAWRRRSKSS